MEREGLRHFHQQFSEGIAESKLLLAGFTEATEKMARTLWPPDERNMKPEQRFHSYVTAATVVVMFYFIKYVIPLLVFGQALDAILKPAVAMLASVGVYRILAGLILQAASRWRWVKRFLLGASYMNGTWVGKFLSSSNGAIHTVEHFEQTLSSLKIRGQGFDVRGSSYAYWHSVSEAINESSGLISYVYYCDTNSDTGSFQGVAVFFFERSDERSAPRCIRGYSADLVDGRRSGNTEIKISEQLLPFEAALLEARKLFPD